VFIGSLRRYTTVGSAPAAILTQLLRPQFEKALDIVEGQLHANGGYDQAAEACENTNCSVGQFGQGRPVL
jgi:hypothetical protein